LASIVEINNLSKSYDNFLLDSISLRIEEGFIMGLIGPNGAGKTTLIKLLFNLLRKDSGNIRIFGEDHESAENRIKQKIGFVLDEPGWYEMFRIREMTKIISPFYSEWNESLFQDYLHRFEINQEHRIKNLSKGMKMKFSLAVALSHNAQLIIMDEPTSGLDPIVRQEVLEILQNLIIDEKKSILFSSHISTDVEQIADYITFINKGKIVFSESKEYINDNYLLVKGPLNFLDRDTSTCFDSVKRKSSHFTALCIKPDALEAEFGSSIRGGKMLVEKAGIDDIMFLTVKGEQYAHTGL